MSGTGAPAPRAGSGDEPAPEASAGQAHVRVVRGAADEVELAALVAGLVAAHTPHAHHASAPAPPVSAWADRARGLRVRPAPHPGPDAWRWSTRA